MESLKERTIMMDTKEIKFTASGSSGEVSGISIIPNKAKCMFVFAHGAGAGMKHPFMSKISFLLADNNIGSFRYNFPYTEKKMKRPDPAPVLMETIRSAIITAAELSGGIPIFAGGKSMGGRMTSIATSAKKLDGIRGIIFFGFPLHPPGKPSVERSAHLYNLEIPMLFLQGSKDKLAELKLLNPIVEKLGKNASIRIFEGADHSFQVPKSTGRSNDELLLEVVNAVSVWIDPLI